MEPALALPFPADRVLDAGDLDCGGGLLALIRRHLDPLGPGGLLEIRSTEPSVDSELAAWCRLTSNELVAFTQSGQTRSFLVCRGPHSARAVQRAPADHHPPAIEPFSVISIGSWPRPAFIRRALRDHLEGRLDRQRFESLASRATAIAVDAQLRAGVDVVSDGEQSRDAYASFVGMLLENCELVPLTDLLPLVEHPQEFEQSLRALDVPAETIRHPLVLGPISRKGSLACAELASVRELCERPVKVALPGPYVLVRTMWLECLVERAYPNRDRLAEDIVRVLREEIADLLAAGAALVQLDEPVLTEVVFGAKSASRSFMCGALSARDDAGAELAFASDLLNRVAAGFPRERLAVHTCRGNWTTDERKALSGGYEPLLEYLSRIEVGTLLLEGCTPRAGAIEVLRGLPGDRRVGLGLVNPKSPTVEPLELVLERARRARAFLGDRLLLTSDCGFSTFAESPVCDHALAQAKLAVLAQAREMLRS